MKPRASGNIRAIMLALNATLLLTTLVCGCGGGGGGGETPTITTPWGTARLIGIGSGRSESPPQIAFDPNGNAIAVWLQPDGDFYNVMASRYSPGSGWSTASIIGASVQFGASPQIALDPDGDAIAVWSQGTPGSIWANHYTAGSGWGTAGAIENNINSAAYPQIAIDANGNAIVVWVQNSSLARTSIWANRYIPGSGWGTERAIETDETGNAEFPQLAIDANGNAIVVWYQLYANRNSIWANRYTPGSGLGAAERIENDDTNHAHTPQIGMDPNGNAIAVWSQYEGMRVDVWANRYTPGPGWGTAELIETDNVNSTSSPQVAMDPNGNAIAVWGHFSVSSNNIWSNRYTPGSGWGMASPIGDGGIPQIALDPNGNGIAVWQGADGNQIAVWANRYTAPSWDAATSLALGEHPQIAIDSNGNAIAVWEQLEGTHYNIWAYHFD